ncbi:RTA1 like protein-domain-containing protein [Truncatella angustata]|uniref:RTA1 like protein-domain-containing protein n=1 Tax=Truncatella angustata TaxID=152316 RepID=A0A9P8UXQ3_9PEZI|nr:RTA1 like protein-domain-containing protein [Truncatella angustata]KAH6659931.1 RTA1 like protein-domain-containing protein [Truncatella angustata]
MEITSLSSCTYNTCSISSSPYGYRPSRGVSIVFISSFTSSFIGLQLITLHTKKWLSFSIPLSITCLFEMIGYAIRFTNWDNPWDIHLYAVSEFFLTIAPTMMTSSIYLIIERMLFILGREHSVVNPRWYRFFILADIISLATQLVGLGISMWDIAATYNAGPGSDKGGRVIAVGIGIHALLLTIFLVLFVVALVQAIFAYRELGYTTFNPEGGRYKSLQRRFKIFLAVLLIDVLCLLTRDVYRTIGFVEGFDGGTRIEGWFALFDGLVVSEAVLGLAVLHPSYVFTDYSKKQEADKLSTSSPISYGRLVRQSII